MRVDLCQFAMVAGYVNANMADKIVTCEAFARRLPPQRRFMIMTGTQEIKDALLSLHKISTDELFYIFSSIPFMKEADTPKFRAWLDGFCKRGFSGDLWAMAEGEVVFAGEPLIRITATLPEVQLAEMIILSILNHDIKIASKAARIVLAASGNDVVDFCTCETHPESAINAARAAYLAGFAGTSNMEASRRFGIPIYSTMGHMWITSTMNEQEAFLKFGNLYNGTTLLIDTYDAIKGVKKALNVKELHGVCLNSGDVQLYNQIRTILDTGGVPNSKIVALGDFNEHIIFDMMREKAPIDIFGIDTGLSVSSDVSSLGIVYNAVQDETNRRPISGSKTTMPGRKQVFLDQRNGSWAHLVAVDGTVEPSDDVFPLMDCYIRRGHKVDGVSVDLKVSRSYCNANMSSLASLPISYDLSSLKHAEESWAPVKPHVSLGKAYEEATNFYSNKR